MFKNLFQIVTGERSIVTSSEQVKTTAEEHKVVKSKFMHDIQALKDAGYSLVAGEAIVLDLKSALELMPRTERGWMRTRAWQTILIKSSIVLFM